MLRFAVGAVTALVVTVPAPAQIDQIKAKLDAEGRVELHTSGLVIEKADYRHDGKAVEAVLVHAWSRATTGARSTRCRSWCGSPAAASRCSP